MSLRWNEDSTQCLCASRVRLNSRRASLPRESRARGKRASSSWHVTAFDNRGRYLKLRPVGCERGALSSGWRRRRCSYLRVTPRRHEGRSWRNDRCPIFGEACAPRASSRSRSALCSRSWGRRPGVLRCVSRERGVSAPGGRVRRGFVRRDARVGRRLGRDRGAASARWVRLGTNWDGLLRRLPDGDRPVPIESDRECLVRSRSSSMESYRMQGACCSSRSMEGGLLYGSSPGMRTPVRG